MCLSGLEPAVLEAGVSTSGQAAFRGASLADITHTLGDEYVLYPVRV